MAMAVVPAQCYSDTIKIGTLSIPGQAVEVATHSPSSFLSSNGSDGLLGLAFPSINTVSPTQQENLWSNSLSKILITNPIFTFKLDKGDSTVSTPLDSSTIPCCLHLPPLLYQYHLKWILEFPSQN
ncbi:hypothetical protein BS47DRAFT_978659 [Hydnum rufescens UP504]|uniref:Peptidase A1 domain-containing protein n=1 Tax=Hydnum rufescens UP504 TaxID=1448309 RepID=A0A9P6ACZ8_9AGAM|nr:hypothetical protein BS47DRAFT_978659 [Hydnum rufescens UP504]